MACVTPGLPTFRLYSRYSDPKKILAGIDQLLIRNLNARRGIDGPQIILTWNPPTDPDSVVTLIRIVRKLYEFPLNEIDGTIVFNGPVSAISFADYIDVPADKCLYYKVFTFRSDTGEWVSSSATQINIVALITGDDHWRKLFTFMGEAIIVGDKDLEHSGEAKIILDKKFGPDGEVFNLYEIGEKKGPLARFYKIWGAIFDEAKELIDNMRLERKVDEACFDYLPLIAHILALDLNRELSIPRQRLEIKNRTAILKAKGTKQSIESVIQGITGFNAEIKEWCYYSFISNDSTRVTAKSGSQSVIDYGTVNENLFYSACSAGKDLVIPASCGSSNKIRKCNSISIYLSVISSKICISPEIIKKVNRGLKEVLPACTSYEILWQDETYIEEYDIETEVLETIDESEIQDENIEENIWSDCWIISNKIDRLSNKTEWITPGINGTCGDSWFDEIEIAGLYSRYSDEVVGSPA